MTIHSSILAWRIPMDRRVWQGNHPCNHPWGYKELDTTEQLSTQRERNRRRVRKEGREVWKARKFSPHTLKPSAFFEENMTKPH